MLTARAQTRLASEIAPQRLAQWFAICYLLFSIPRSVFLAPPKSEPQRTIHQVVGLPEPQQDAGCDQQKERVHPV